MSNLEHARFLNALKIMRSIDGDEFASRVSGSHADWETFRDHPFTFMLSAGQVLGGKLWALIEERQPKPLAMLPVHQALEAEAIVERADAARFPNEREAVGRDAVKLLRAMIGEKS